VNPLGGRPLGALHKKHSTHARIVVTVPISTADRECMAVENAVMTFTLFQAAQLLMTILRQPGMLQSRISRDTSSRIMPQVPSSGIN
jgi:hypothetical protein